MSVCRAIIFTAFFSSIARPQSIARDLSHHIVNEEYKEAFSILQKTKEVEIQKRAVPILFNFASYEDYLVFIRKSNFASRNDFQNLVYFLDKRVEAPRSTKHVNLDYVKLMYQKMNIVANRLELGDAAQIAEELNKYINSVSEKTDKNFKLAQLYAQTFETLLGVIERDEVKLKQSKTKMDKALELGDTLLHLHYAMSLAELFILNKDLEGYITLYDEKLELAASINAYKDMYFTMSNRLLDGLIYAPNSDNDRIEQLLFEMFN
jgi:hypothetical protein